MFHHSVLMKEHENYIYQKELLCLWWLKSWSKPMRASWGLDQRGHTLPFALITAAVWPHPRHVLLARIAAGTVLYSESH